MALRVIERMSTGGSQADKLALAQARAGKETAGKIETLRGQIAQIDKENTAIAWARQKNGFVPPPVEQTEIANREIKRKLEGQIRELKLTPQERQKRDRDQMLNYMTAKIDPKAEAAALRRHQMRTGYDPMLAYTGYGSPGDQAIADRKVSKEWVQQTSKEKRDWANQQTERLAKNIRPAFDFLPGAFLTPGAVKDMQANSAAKTFLTPVHLEADFATATDADEDAWTRVGGGANVALTVFGPKIGKVAGKQAAKSGSGALLNAGTKGASAGSAATTGQKAAREIVGRMEAAGIDLNRISTGTSSRSMQGASGAKPWQTHEAAPRPKPEQVSPYSFYRTSKGEIDYGRIPAEIEKSTSGRFVSAPIRLQVGEEGPEGFGLLHAGADRIARIQRAGYADVPTFYEDVLANYTMVIEQPNGRLLLVKENGKSHTAVIELKKSWKGPYYTVTTGIPGVKANYLKNSGTVIWTGRAPSATPRPVYRPQAARTPSVPVQGTAVKTTKTNLTQFSGRRGGRN